MQVMRSPFVLGVDLDGTCADFYAGLRPIAAEWLGVAEQSLGSEFSWDLPEWGVAQAPGGYPKLHQFAVLQRDLFRVLRPMPGAPQVLRRLSDMGVRIRIITHRLLIKNFHRAAVQQTVDWLDGHDIPYWDLCFLADKSAVGRRPLHRGLAQQRRAAAPRRIPDHRVHKSDQSPPAGPPRRHLGTGLRDGRRGDAARGLTPRVIRVGPRARRARAAGTTSP